MSRDSATGFNTGSDIDAFTPISPPSWNPIARWHRTGSRLGAWGVRKPLPRAGARSATSLRSNLYGLSPFDPAAYLGVIAIVGVAASVAVALPALRATRVDPVKALRSE